MGKDIYSRVKYPKGQRSVGQVRMGTDVRGIGVKRESTHVALPGGGGEGSKKEAAR